MTILRYPRGLRNKGLITQKTLFQHAFAQSSRYRVETSQVLKYVNDSLGQVVENLTILWFARWLRNEGLITEKT